MIVIMIMAHILPFSCNVFFFFQTFCFHTFLCCVGDPMYVEVWDRSLLLSDDLIGRTRIDLENRLFCQDWLDEGAKPIEQRTIWVQESSFPQGRLEMAVDILTLEAAARAPFVPLSPPHPRPHELRVIIWNTEDVVFKDAVRVVFIFLSGYSYLLFLS